MNSAAALDGALVNAIGGSFRIMDGDASLGLLFDAGSDFAG